MEKAALYITSEQMGVVCANIDGGVLECVRMTVAIANSVAHRPL